jgi:hypothetical protein
MKFTPQDDQSGKGEVLQVTGEGPGNGRGRDEEFFRVTGA